MWVELLSNFCHLSNIIQPLLRKNSLYEKPTVVFSPHTRGSRLRRFPPSENDCFAVYWSRRISHKNCQQFFQNGGQFERLFINQIHDINYRTQRFLGILEAWLQDHKETVFLKSFAEFQVRFTVFLRSFFVALWVVWITTSCCTFPYKFWWTYSTENLKQQKPGNWNRDPKTQNTSSKNYLLPH